MKTNNQNGHERLKSTSLYFEIDRVPFCPAVFADDSLPGGRARKPPRVEFFQGVILGMAKECWLIEACVPAFYLAGTCGKGS